MDAKQKKRLGEIGREAYLEEIGREAHEAALRYEATLKTLEALEREISLLEPKIIREIPQMREEFGSDEAILQYMAENFSPHFVEVMERLLKQPKSN